MTDFERINTPRVEKILKMLEVIEKSAKSNSIPFEEVTRLLEPLASKLSPPTQETKPETKHLSRHPWHTVRELALQAPLKDLTVAMAVYLDRIDEELSK